MVEFFYGHRTSIFNFYRVLKLAHGFKSRLAKSLPFCLEIGKKNWRRFNLNEVRYKDFVSPSIKISRMVKKKKLLNIEFSNQLICTWSKGPNKNWSNSISFIDETFCNFKWAEIWESTGPLEKVPYKRIGLCGNLAGLFLKWTWNTKWNRMKTFWTLLQKTRMNIRLHKEPFVIKSVFGKKGFLLVAKKLDVVG